MEHNKDNMNEGIEVLEDYGITNKDDSMSAPIGPLTPPMAKLENMINEHPILSLENVRYEADAHAKLAASFAIFAVIFGVILDILGIVVVCLTKNYTQSDMKTDKLYWFQLLFCGLHIVKNFVSIGTLISKKGHQLFNGAYWAGIASTCAWIFIFIFPGFYSVLAVFSLTALSIGLYIGGIVKIFCPTTGSS